MTRRLLLLIVSAVLLVPALTTAPAQADRGDRGRHLLAALAACATPRLAPALTPDRGRAAKMHPAARSRAVRALRQGAARGLPARGQAIVLMVLLESEHLEQVRLGGHRAPDADRLARRLPRLRGWQTLPPEIVAHRLLGTPDPFAFEDSWAGAVRVLARMTGRSVAATQRAVSPGARAARSCDPQTGRAYPLPVGSGFQMLRMVTPSPSGQRPAAREGRARDSGSLLLGVSCGVPVLAATNGTVSIRRKDRAAGPWEITVSRGEVRSTYRHVARPVVGEGARVRAGDQLATVGDLGWIDRCALGFGLRIGGTLMREGEVATWLAPEPADSTPLPTVGGDAAGLTDSGATTSVRITTFNVLGAHLTGPGSDRPRFGPGGARMAAAMTHLNRSGSSIALFQEFESPQAAVVSATPGWELHRATGNSRFRTGNYSGNAIAWRTDTWELVSTSEFTVPWQVRLHMPVVQLRHRATGAAVAVVGVHNPASTALQGNQSRSRGIARAIEKQAVAAIRARTGVPVLVGGDLNERDDAICDFAGAGWSTWHQRSGGCGSWGYGGVDHVFGAGQVAFTSLSVDRSTLGSVSDHPMVTAAVTLNP